MGGGGNPVLMMRVGGGTPSQVWTRGNPFPGQGGGGIPHSQVWMGGIPSHVWMGMGYPIPGLDGGGGIPSMCQCVFLVLFDRDPGGQGVLWGTLPCPGLDGVPPVQDWMGYVQDWMGYPTPRPVRRQSSIANTCYAAGGMPLAFTQEDFLVVWPFILNHTGNCTTEKQWSLLAK